MSLALHRAVVRIPLVGHVLALIGVCDADKATLVNKLNKVGWGQAEEVVQPWCYELSQPPRQDFRWYQRLQGVQHSFQTHYWQRKGCSFG